MGQTILYLTIDTEADKILSVFFCSDTIITGYERKRLQSCFHLKEKFHWKTHLLTIKVRATTFRKVAMVIGAEVIDMNQKTDIDKARLKDRSEERPAAKKSFLSLIDKERLLLITKELWDHCLFLAASWTRSNVILSSIPQFYSL